MADRYPIKLYNWQVLCPFCGKVFKERGLNKHLTEMRHKEENLIKIRAEVDIPVRKEEILHLK